MRSILVLQVLTAVAVAQFASSRVATSLENVEATATEELSGPIETGRACGQIAKLVEDSSLELPSVEAELAYACLKSVPIDTEAATLTIGSLKQMVEFQSTLVYLKNPPKGYAHEGVDIIAGLDDIGRKVSNGDYNNEYDFENDIAALLIKAHDGHLSFQGMAYSGAFRWRRNRQIALISASEDGKQTPKVWLVHDFNKTQDAETPPSAVTQIDGKDAVQFLQEDSLKNAYHDPDTSYNAMFYMQPAENFGYFTNPRFYPGSEVRLSFENKTDETFSNSAIILDKELWAMISNGQDFYDAFVTPSSANFDKLRKRSTHSLPRHLQNPKEAAVERRYVPVAYPEPVVEHSGEDVPLAGYFIDTSAGAVGVLMIQTFNTEDNDGATEFQAVVQEYISQAKSRNVQKHIIDVRTNGGGKILLGYETYLQFFPSQDPQLLSRYRGHRASELIGSSISSFPELNSSNGEIFTSPFNFHSYLTKDQKPFSSWTDMYPPTRFNSDAFTTLLRYNLSDPLTTSSERYSIGLTMTGHGARANFTDDPFRSADIVVLTDGICASTCSLFTELMVQQSGVKTLAIGGRPQPGPMQAVGGTKGSLVLQAQYLASLSAFVATNFATDSREMDDWRAFLPRRFGIATADASVNFQDNIRAGDLAADGMPTQFLNDSASCRIWYEPRMYLNVSRVWERAAEVAFGRDGGLDEEQCVGGSVASRQAQQGGGEGNPSTGLGGEAPRPSESKGAAAGVGRAAAGGGWMATLGSAGVVVVAMALGASLI